MTAEKPQPHPQRCQTCKNTECECYTGRDSKGNYIFGIVSIQKFTEKFGCASHSASEPDPHTVSDVITDIAWVSRKLKEDLKEENLAGILAGILDNCIIALRGKVPP